MRWRVEVESECKGEEMEMARSISPVTQSSVRSSKCVQRLWMWS